MKTWKIFIITHSPIIEDYYKNDPLFSNSHYTFFNVADIPISHKKFKIINKSSISDFIHLGKWFAEAEAIYNIYKCNLYKKYDYIGFIHWDYELKSENQIINYNISSTIEKVIAQDGKFISFSTFNFWEDFNQHIMMDLELPNQLTGNGKNCWNTICQDYNEYFKTNIEIDYLMTKRINLCSAFMCESSVFKELMDFYCTIVDSEKLNKFDLNHEHRYQGGILERYIGCYSSQFNLSEIPLYHHWSDKNKAERKSIFNKFRTSLKK